MTESIHNQLRLRFHQSYDDLRPPEDERKRLLIAAKSLSLISSGIKGGTSAGAGDDTERLSGQLLELAIRNKEVNRL